MTEFSLGSGDSPGSVFNAASEVIRLKALAIGVLGTLGALAICPLTHGSHAF